MKPIDVRLRDLETEMKSIDNQAPCLCEHNYSTCNDIEKQMKEAELKALTSLREDLIEEAKGLNRKINHREGSILCQEYMIESPCDCDKERIICICEIEERAELSRIAKTIYDSDDQLKDLMEAIK